MTSWVERGILDAREGTGAMPKRSSESYVGSEGRIGTPLLNEIFDRAKQLSASKQRELVDELFEKAEQVGVRPRPSKTARAQRALDRLEKLTQDTPSRGTRKPPPDVVMGFEGQDRAPQRTPQREAVELRTVAKQASLSESRVDEIQAVEVPGFDNDRTPAQGIVPLGAHYAEPARQRNPGRRRKQSAARSSKESRRQRKASPQRSEAQGKTKRTSKPKTRRSRSRREDRIKPLSELPPLPTTPEALPSLEADAFGFGFSGVDEDHLAELDRLVANTNDGWTPKPPRPPSRDLVSVGSESDDELAIF